MTEAEWLEGESAGQMIEHVKRTAGLSPSARGRKYRFAAIAMLQGLPAGEVPAALAPILEAAEQLCDGRCSLADLDRTVGAAGLYTRSDVHPNWGLVAACLGGADGLTCLRGVAGATQVLGRPLVPGALRLPFVAVQCRILREIFGNPFRPVAFSPDWRTDTAVLLARQMHDSRDFSAMPILADALQDAGCDNEGILAHCRDPKQIHVRGCWVVDLVLGNA